MTKRYEYKFERIGEGMLGVKKSAKTGYQDVIREHAMQGWRLVQIFAPGIGAYGMTKYFEMIFEREK